MKNCCGTNFIDDWMENQGMNFKQKIENKYDGKLHTKLFES